jgi:hypothetical protein
MRHAVIHERGDAFLSQRDELAAVAQQSDSGRAYPVFRS